MENLNQKMWWRFLKVVYVVLWIIALLIVSSLGYSELPRKSIDFGRAEFECSNKTTWTFYPTNPVYVLDSPNLTAPDEEDIRKTCMYDNNWRKNPNQLSAPLPEKNYTLHYVYNTYGGLDKLFATVVIGFIISFIVIEAFKSAILYVLGISIWRGGLFYLILFLASFNGDKQATK